MGVAVNIVAAMLPVAYVDKADSVAEVMFVTAEAVALRTAALPYIEIDQLVVEAAHDNKCPIAYSPAVRVDAANVNG